MVLFPLCSGGLGRKPQPELFRFTPTAVSSLVGSVMTIVIPDKVECARASELWGAAIVRETLHALVRGFGCFGAGKMRHHFKNLLVPGVCLRSGVKTSVSPNDYK